MRFLGRLLLGTGTLPSSVRTELEAEAEGGVYLEEGVPATIRYTHFKAPGKRFHGKVTPVRVGIGISEERLAVYSTSGRAELIDSSFSSPRMGAVEVSLDGAEKVDIHIDYSLMPNAAEAMVSGEITIGLKSLRAPLIFETLVSRMSSGPR